MTIQLSVTVWTVICFVLLLFVLHNLLFKPILNVIDKRNKRIEDSKLKKAEYEKVQSENESLLREKKKSFSEARLKRTEEEIELIRANGKSAVREAQAKRLETVENYRLKTDAEQKEILSVLEEHSDSLALMFAESLVKG